MKVCGPLRCGVEGDLHIPYFVDRLASASGFRAKALGLDGRWQKAEGRRAALVVHISRCCKNKRRTQLLLLRISLDMSLRFILVVLLQGAKGVVKERGRFRALKLD